MLRNAIASSRSSHVFDLTRVTSVWGRRMAKGEEERGIALRTKREREREREREKRPSKYYLESGMVSSGWYPMSVGCNASRFRSRSSSAEPICPAVKKRDDVRQREPERDGERMVEICIYSCASYPEPDTLCRLRVLTDQERARTTNGRQIVAAIATADDYHTSPIRAAKPRDYWSGDGRGARPASGLAEPG